MIVSTQVQKNEKLKHIWDYVTGE